MKNVSVSHRTVLNCQYQLASSVFLKSNSDSQIFLFPKSASFAVGIYPPTVHPDFTMLAASSYSEDLCCCTNYLSHKCHTFCIVIYIICSYNAEAKIAAQVSYTLPSASRAMSSTAVIMKSFTKFGPALLTQATLLFST